MLIDIDRLNNAITRQNFKITDLLYNICNIG